MEQKNEKVYIGLGSNMGDRLKYLTDAISMLKHTEGINLKSVSPVYETKPVGYTEQPNFLNCVVEIITTLSAHDILNLCMRIERDLDRKRTIRWGPRTADLDVLFYGNQVIDEKDLTIPHPRIQERGFVLVPLVDIAPDFKHPVFNKIVSELFHQFKGDYGNMDDIKLFDRIKK
ncbi:MAG: 2-amino-4-hydroxy-6-hydroxymethyldihydropteridine diphosphokinase [Clostridiales bacterium]|nr:2-amino-4-hydroxy-6-hydroxymethyldihydropteridine diphosphokinase [Clostridiales bacterium]